MDVVTNEETLARDNCTRGDPKGPEQTVQLQRPETLLSKVLAHYCPIATQFEEMIH